MYKVQVRISFSHFYLNSLWLCFGTFSSWSSLFKRRRRLGSVLAQRCSLHLTSPEFPGSGEPCFLSLSTRLSHCLVLEPSCLPLFITPAPTSTSVPPSKQKYIPPSSSRLAIITFLTELISVNESNYHCVTKKFGLNFSSDFESQVTIHMQNFKKTNGERKPIPNDRSLQESRLDSNL